MPASCSLRTFRETNGSPESRHDLHKMTFTSTIVILKSGLIVFSYRTAPCTGQVQVEGLFSYLPQVVLSFHPHKESSKTALPAPWQEANPWTRL